MYATLENRETHSLLAINALKVHNAIHHNGDARKWAALFILSSTVTTVDYLVGTLWRLPVSIITIPLTLFGRETKLPTIKELFLSAAKTFFCAIGILIFPLVGIFNPKKAFDLVEEFGLVILPKPQVPVPVPVPVVTITKTEPEEKKRGNLSVDLSATDLQEKKKMIHIIPENYKNKNVVYKPSKYWDKVSKITTAHVNIKVTNAEGIAVAVFLFPNKWNTKNDRALPLILQRGKIKDVPLWEYVARRLHIERKDREPAVVMKEIITTLYQPEPVEVVEKEKAPKTLVVEQQKKSSNRELDIAVDESPRKRSIPKIDMAMWNKLEDIRQEDLVFKDPADGKYVPPWKGPVFLATYLAEWEEVELKRSMEKTLYKGEPLLDVVARKLNINANPNVKSTRNKRLKVIEDIIHKVYPMEEKIF